MQIRLNSVLVSNQAKALAFYMDVLGFVKKRDIPMGEYSWMTVVSPDNLEGTELLLEPLGFPPAAVYQKALFDAGIPLTAFAVSDVFLETRRLEQLGVVFQTPPTDMGGTVVAVFDDTCGNLIQIYQL